MQFNIFEIQPKYGGQIIDIVSRDIREPEEKAEALDAVRDTILEIVLIVVIGYLFLIHLKPKEAKFCYTDS